MSLGWAVLGALALYLLTPALTSTHVEGYTAALQLDAIAAQRNALARADLLYPVQTEYLYVTRQGVVLLLRALMQATGSTSDGLFRALMLASLAVFIATTALLARRHADVGWLAALGGVLLLPGLFELGFHFSDGLVAVAFGTAGLTLLPRALEPASHRPTPAWLARASLGGAALAFAVLCRADALLMLPLALGLAYLEQRRARPLALLCAAAAVGMLATFAIAQAVSGTTLVDALRVGHFFDTLHANIRVVFVRALVCLLFFGLPGLAFAGLGAALTWRTGTRRHRIVLLGLPSLVLLYALRHSTEVRQIYPYIAPFAVMCCARGLQWAAQALAAAPRLRWRAVALFAGTALVWLLPPVFVPVKDGPRAVLGRLWSPPLWRAWQARVDASLGDVDALLARAQVTPKLTLISAHFNTDHYLQLRAWQRGWLPLRVEETVERCGGGVEVWKRGDNVLHLIRLDNTYGLSAIDSEDYMAVHLRDALACPSLDGVPAYVSDFWPPLSTEPFVAALRERLAESDDVAHGFAWPLPVARRIEAAWGWRHLLVPLAYGINRTAPVDADQIARSAVLASRRLAESSVRDGGRAVPAMAALLPRFETRYWKLPALPPLPEVQLPGAPTDEPR